MGIEEQVPGCPHKPRAHICLPCYKRIIKHLEAELAKVVKERDAAINELGEIARKQGRELGNQDVELMKIKADLALCREALRKYGRHPGQTEMEEYCAVIYLGNNRCTCGLDQALGGGG